MNATVSYTFMDYIFLADNIFKWLATKYKCKIVNSQEIEFIFVY